MSTENLKSIIARQREALSALEAECRDLENSDLVRENASLKADIGKLGADCAQARERAAALADENSRLKNALYEQIFNEKNKIINSVSDKLDVFIRSASDGSQNRLREIEHSVRARVQSARDALARNAIDVNAEISAMCDNLDAAANKRITEARAEAEKLPGLFWQSERAEIEAMKGEQITDEQVLAVTKKNNIERFVGLNVLNAAGIFLLIIGVITLARFTYLQLPDLLKGIMLFAFGGAMLVAGELLNRRKPNIFSLGISAGGVGILYAALATSFFALGILDMYVALPVCVLITAAAFLLSSRYNAQVIAAFALIGGYLPMFSIFSDGARQFVLYGAMAYFIVLNLFALLISAGRKWRVAAFIGLVLNIAGTAYIVSMSDSKAGIFAKAAVILYALFAFVIYTAIPIAGTYREKGAFKKSDIVLLAINTVFSSLTMYFAFYRFGLGSFNGLLTAAFALIYLLLGRFVEKKFTGDERHTRALFYLTGLAFVVIIIPVQFERSWLSLGWLAEGVLLAAYGILREHRRFKQAGLVISLLCFGAFVMVDCTMASDYLFVFKYLAVTLGSIVILGAYARKKMLSGIYVKIYKYCTFINVWIFGMYLVFGKLIGFLSSTGTGLTYSQLLYLVVAAAVVATYLLAYAFLRIRLLADSGTKAISVALYIIGAFMLFCSNALFSPFSAAYPSSVSSAVRITFAGTVVLAALALLSVFAMRDLVIIFVSGRRLGVEWYPLIVSGYFVVMLTQNLITQYGLSFSSAVISIIYVLAALAWTVVGFARRYPVVRRFGLGLAILSVVKLFLIDLQSLTQGYRIITYFALGITLVAISFVYQYFSKRLELKETEASSNVQKNG